MQQVDRCELLTLLNVIDSRFFLLNDVFPWFNVFSFIPFFHFIFLDNFDIQNDITLIKLSINKLTKGFETSSTTLGQSLNISQMKSCTNRSFGWLFKLYLNRILENKSWSSDKRRWILRSLCSMQQIYKK